MRDPQTAEEHWSLSRRIQVAGHFVWRQAARALIEPQTTDAIIVVELLPQLDEAATEAFAADLAEGLAKHFGDAATPQILGADDSTVELGR